MRAKVLASAVLVASGLGVATFVQAGSDDKKVERRPIHVSSHDGKWRALPIGGVEEIVIAGDPTKGAHETFTKFPAGADHGWHTHTSEVRIVVVSGTYVFRDEHGTETRVKAGDYLFVPAGLEHWSGTDEGCIFYQSCPDKFDLVPAKK